MGQYHLDVSQYSWVSMIVYPVLIFASLVTHNILFTLAFVGEAAREGGLVGTLGACLTQFAGGVVIIWWVGNRLGVVLEKLGTIIRDINFRVLLRVLLSTILKLAERVVVRWGRVVRLFLYVVIVAGHYWFARRWALKPAACERYDTDTHLWSLLQ